MCIDSSLREPVTELQSVTCQYQTSRFYQKLLSEQLLRGICVMSLPTHFYHPDKVCLSSFPLCQDHAYLCAQWSGA